MRVWAGPNWVVPGVSRLAMLRLGLRDLQTLYQSDIDWLSKSPVCGD